MRIPCLAATPCPPSPTHPNNHCATAEHAGAPRARGAGAASERRTPAACMGRAVGAAAAAGARGDLLPERTCAVPRNRKYERAGCLCPGPEHAAAGRRGFGGCGARGTDAGIGEGEEGRGRGGGLGAARWEEWGSGEQAVGECLDWQVPSLLGARWGWALRGPHARQANVMTGGRTPIALWQGRAVVAFSDVKRQSSAMFRHPPSQTPFPDHCPAPAPHHLGTCPSGFRIHQDGAPELHRRPYPEHSQGAL